ncbi:MAG: glycosyltransferase family 9 protein [Planctomycetota bacterium]
MHQPRVCIVRLGAFGDIVHTLPLAADLAAAGWLVDWLCEDRWADLLRGSPAIDRLHLLPRGAWRRAGTPLHRKRRDLRRLMTGIRRQRPDAVIDAQGLAKSAVLARMTGLRPVVGHRPPRAREGSRLLHDLHAPSQATHVIDQQRALALPLLGRAHPGGDWCFPLPIWPQQQEGIDGWFQAQGLRAPWALNVGAGWVSKRWPAMRQTTFLQACLEAGQRPLIVWGGRSEHEEARELQRAVPGSVLAPATDLPGLACLLRRCAVLVSADTGPLHLARALGTPAVGLFGPVPAERNGVRGRYWCNLGAPGAAAWERHDPSRTHMDRITVAAVMDACRRVTGRA